MKILSERQRLELMAQDCKEVLIGKVIPGDMDEGGGVAEYFAAKYLNAMRDLLDRDSQVAALTAENVALKESVDHAAGCIHAAEFEGLADALSSTTDSRLADLVHRRLCHAYLAVKTPTTDAAANALRAEGVDMYGNLTIAIGKEEDDSDIIYAGQQALLYAKKLREGKV